MATQIVSAADIDRLKLLDTCTVSNAVERLGGRPRNEGFVYGTARCLFPRLPSTVGFAATGTIRSSTQPISGGWYYDVIDWWKYVASVPAPRVIVLQDIDERPGFGAFVGEIHASIATALHSVGYVTNGAVRDLPAVEALAFQLFAGGVAPSHAYAHVVEWGQIVDIGGLKIGSGDLLHGDRHGVYSVPPALVPDIPREAAILARHEQELIDLCRSSEFSLDALSTAFDRIRGAHADRRVLPHSASKKS